MIGIYKITNPKNKIYIGQSINIEKRFKEYLNINNCKNQTKLYNSLKYYGVLLHNFEIVCLCSENELNNQERKWQDYYDVLSKKGLNLKLTSLLDKSGKLSNETKNKISVSNKGKIRSQKIKDKISNSKKGAIISKETRYKMKIAKIGFKHSENSRLKMSESAKGKKMSLESKKKIAESKNKKIIDSNTGKIYNSMKEICLIFNINISTLSNKLTGRRKNNTTFKYYE